ncbi:MAG: efflux RND transporter periplasmic adaptor subunit, partial [Acidobacteria bacterium]|nr:efflux RND transporter periplasmic adaptor subunit [Acidobacteriota bacterium]
MHFTSLDTFKPLTSGKVEVLLNGKDGSTEVFTTPGPSRPGIFGVDVAPKRAGEYRMSVAVSAPDLSDKHELGAVTVYPDEKAAAHEDDPAKEETIAFLKEQQWSLDFATEVVKNRPARDVMRVPAEIVPRAGGEAAVTAPFSGRLASSSLPPIGTTVQKGQVLATLL